MMCPSWRSLARAIISAALGPPPPMRMSSGPSRRNEKPRAASSICIDETPTSNTIPSIVPALGLFDQAGALGDRALIAIDADDAGTGGRQNRLRVAAGAESRIDVKSAVANA